MGLGVTGTPTVGSVMVGLGGAYDATFGHCALVEQVAPSWSFLVKEMNFAAWNHYDERWTTLSHVSGFLLPPGVRAGQTNAPGSTDRRGRNDLEASWSEFRNLAGVELPATHDRLRSVAANFRTLTP